MRKSSCWLFWREPTSKNNKTVTEVTHGQTQTKREEEDGGLKQNWIWCLHQAQQQRSREFNPTEI
jgi:hypothetical protein